MMQIDTPPPAGAEEPKGTVDEKAHTDRDTAEEIYTAKQSTLVWRAFKRHRLAMVGLVITIAFYAVALFAEFLAPYSPSTFNAQATYAPPQQLQIVDTSGESWDWGLHVHGYTASRDSETLALTYEVDESTKI